MRRTLTMTGLAVITAFMCAACSKKEAKGSGSNPAPSFAQANTKENLAALLKKILELKKAGKDEAAGALTRGLLPTTKARLSKALRPDAPADKVTKMQEMIARFSKAPDGRLAGLLRAKPSQTEIQVHCATTIEIARNAPGSIVFKEFPGGAVSLAANLLKNGVTFCEVEFTEPGKDRGMKYHLFYWDGSAWTMLGPMWRAMR